MNTPTYKTHNIKYDFTGLLITAVVIAVVFAVAFILPRQANPTPLFYIAITLLSASLLLAIAFSPRCITIDADTLVIHRKLGKRILKKRDIADLRRQDLLPSDIQIFGSGGVFGYTGWWYSQQHGRYFSYRASRDNTVMITLSSGKKYMISVENPHSFISDFNSLTR